MKLLSGGCSLIYGSELQDEFPGSKGYSHNTYPALLAKFLGMEYACAARPGYGSDAIVRQVVSALDDETKLVMINWTYFDRFEFHFDDIGWQNIKQQPGETAFSNLPNRISNYRRAFYGELTKVYSHYSYLKDVVFMQNFLRQLDIPYVFSSATEELFDVNNFCSLGIEHKNLYNQIDFSNWFFWPGGLGFLSWSDQGRFKKGPMGHPLEESHLSTMVLIKDFIKEKNIL